MDENKNPTPTQSGPNVTPSVPPDTYPVPSVPPTSEFSTSDVPETSPTDQPTSMDMPPLVPPPPPKSKTRLIAAIAAVILLAVAIPAGIFLVGQSQEIRKNAQEAGPPPPPIIGGDVVTSPTPTPGAEGGPPPVPGVASPTPEPTPESGKTGQFRRCEINTTTGALESCGSWTAGTLTLEKPVVAYGAFTYTESGKQFVVQSLVEDNGTTGRYRTCEINPALQGGFTSNNCGAWKTGITFDPAIVSYGAYSFTLGGKQYAVQSVIETDGKTSKFRKCEIGAGGVLSACAQWSNITLPNETGAYGAYEYTGSDSKTYIVQSLVDKGGKTSQYRKCSLNTTTGALENCGAWQGPITFPEEVVSYGAFSFTHPSGKQYVVQSITTAEAPLPSSISATITGPTTSQAGESVKFTATASGGNLKWIRAYWTKKDPGNLEELKKRTAWRGLGQFADCTGSTCSQEFTFIPPSPGTYFMVVNALQVDPQGNSIPCSGNPLVDKVKIPSQSPIKGAQDGGWIDCGPNDRVELTASGILGAPNCSEIQLARAGSTIKASDITLNDTITATAFCSTTDSTDNFDKMHFRVVAPAGTRADSDKTEVERVANKDSAGKRFYSASNTFKVDQEGAYKIQVWAHSPKKGWGGK